MSFGIIDVGADTVIGDEQLGSKTKFWFAHDGARWLFKEARAHTGEDWAEKVVSEIASIACIPAARVELADFHGRRGSASLLFVNANEESLIHGNEILASQILGYDRDKNCTEEYRAMKSLFLAWQSPNRAWFPVGRLDADVPGHRYLFGYTKGALKAQKEEGFQAHPAFPNLECQYESLELFPLFQNRVLGSNRKNFAEYLESLGLSNSDPIEILAVTGGERQTDSFQVFPKIEAGIDGAFTCRFFVHGMRYVPEPARLRTKTLSVGERLGVSIELDNPKTGLAIQLTTRDDRYLIGWTPHFLVEDLLKAIGRAPDIQATVIRVNLGDVPINRRVLVEFRGKLPIGVEPMSTEPFQLIERSKHRH